MVRLQGQNGNREWSCVSHCHSAPSPPIQLLWNMRTPCLPSLKEKKRERERLHIGRLENKCFGRGVDGKQSAGLLKHFTCPAAQHNTRMEEKERVWSSLVTCSVRKHWLWTFFYLTGNGPNYKLTFLDSVLLYFRRICHFLTSHWYFFAMQNMYTLFMYF